MIEIPVNNTNAAIKKFCDQNLRGNVLSIVFLVESSDYAQRADDEQKQLAFIYAVISDIMILAVAMFVFGTTVYAMVSKIFLGTYESVGVSQQIDFSCVSSISAYVPQARHDRFSYPLLVSDISKIQNKYIVFGHSDQSGSVEVHNLIHEVPIEDEDEDGNKSSLFNEPHHYTILLEHQECIFRCRIELRSPFLHQTSQRQNVRNWTTIEPHRFLQVVISTHPIALHVSSVGFDRMRERNSSIAIGCYVVSKSTIRENVTS